MAATVDLDTMIVTIFPYTHILTIMGAQNVEFLYRPRWEKN